MGWFINGPQSFFKVINPRALFIFDHLIRGLRSVLGHCYGPAQPRKQTRFQFSFILISIQVFSAGLAYPNSMEHLNVSMASKLALVCSTSLAISYAFS